MSRADEKKERRYTTFEDFYPFYLTEHSDPTNRRLHLVGTTIVALIVLYVILTGVTKNLLYCPLVGYGFAWVGHFFFQKNKPATFKYPLFSFMGDWKMWWQWVSGEKPF